MSIYIIWLLLNLLRLVLWPNIFHQGKQILESHALVRDIPYISILNLCVMFYCCFSVTQLCLTLCDSLDCSMPCFPILHHLLEMVQTHVHWVGDAIQPFHLLCPFLLLPSIFFSIRVFSNELALCLRWPKYKSFSLSISPCNEYSGLIAFRIDWFDLFSTKRLSRGFS